jgi:hypothetical protein
LVPPGLAAFKLTNRVVVSPSQGEKPTTISVFQEAKNPMTERVETGACFCGTIAAELRGDPFWICYDHDDDCRRAVGGPLNVWVGYRPGEFRLTRGAPKSFSKTKGVVRTFCPDCGTSIAYCDEGLDNELYVSIGFLDHPERFEPEAHAYWEMKLTGVKFSDDLPKAAGYTRPRDSPLGYPSKRGPPPTS